MPSLGAQGLQSSGLTRVSKVMTVKTATGILQQMALLVKLETRRADESPTETAV